jgi:hypothetical protein
MDFDTDVYFTLAYAFGPTLFVQNVTLSVMIATVFILAQRSDLAFGSHSPKLRMNQSF